MTPNTLERQERMAEIERKIAYTQELADACDNKRPFEKRIEDLRAELSRLSNEQPKGLEATVTTCPGCGKPVTSYWHRDNTGCESRPGYLLVADSVFHAGCWPSPAPSPGAQDVREALGATEIAKYKTLRSALLSAFPYRADAEELVDTALDKIITALAAIAQSDAQPVVTRLAIPQSNPAPPLPDASGLVEAEWQVGDQVEKYTGDYSVFGEVRGVFTLKGGAIRFAVEINAEGGGSFIHVYSAKNLRTLAADRTAK